MKTIHIVQAYFESFDEVWSIIIGTFTNSELAQKHKLKWEKFYHRKKKLFDEPDDWKPIDNEYNYMMDVDSWTDSWEYEELNMKYEEVKYFKEIRIVEIQADKDLFHDTEYKRTESMNELIKDWNRNYKIGDILGDEK